MNNIYLKFFYITFILICFIIVIYNSYFFEINIFGDRDLVRAANLPNSFEIYGYEFGMQNGRRIPGGFYYYYLGLLEIFTNNVLIKNYISIFFSIISFWYLFKLNKKIFNRLDFKLSFLFFLTSTCFLQQTSIFWNPTFGLPFSILGIAYFINFLDNQKKIILFISFVFIFLASQFHISYMSFIFVFIMTLIIFKKYKLLSISIILIASFSLCYLPYLVNFLFPLVDVSKNSYQIVQNSSSLYINEFNIFVWFVKKQFFNFDLLLSVISKNFFISRKFLVVILLIISSLLVYIFFKLIKVFDTKIIKRSLKNKITILLLIFICSIYTLFNSDLYTNIFTLPTFILVTSVLILNKKFSNKDSYYLFIKKKLYPIICLYLLVFFITNAGYFFTYGQATNIINGSNRFTLGLLPVYAILSGITVSILLEIFLNTINKKRIIPISIIFAFLLFQLLNASYFISFKKNEPGTNSYIAQKEALDNLGNIYNLNKKDYFNQVGFVKYENKLIVPMEKIGLSYYLNSKTKYLDNNKTNNCFLVIFNSSNKVSKLQTQKDLNDFLITGRDNVTISNLLEFKNYIILEYTDKNNLCINNLDNDYILSAKEKDIERFLLNKPNQKSYKVKKNNLINYYFDLSSNDFLLPVNMMLSFKIKNNQLNFKIISKVLRNSSSKLNGFWDEVQFYKPKIIFTNLKNYEENLFLLTKNEIGNDIYKSPITYSNINLPEGNYKVEFEINKINSLFMNQELNDIKFVIDKNFNLKY